MKALIKLLYYARPYKWYFVKASIFSLLNKVFDVLPEIILGVAVNVASGTPTFLQQYLGITSLVWQLVLLSILVFIVWTAESIFEYAQITLWKRLAQLVQKKLRLDTFWHVLHLSMDELETQSPGDLTSVINDDINQLERFLDIGLNSFIHLIVGTVIIGAVFFVSVPLLGFIVLFPIPLIIIAAIYFQNILADRYNSVRNAAGILGAQLTNVFLGILTVKSYSSEEYELQRLKNSSIYYQEKNKEVAHVGALFTPAIRTIIIFGFISTLLVGGTAVLNGTLSLGTYSMLMFLIQRLLWPFIKLPDILNMYQRALASSRRVFKLLDQPITVIDDKKSSLVPVKGALAFEKVSFCYPQGTCVFDNLSFTIEPSQTVAFIGGTGSGKSTLAKLILRLYPHYQGSINIDGQKIEDYSLYNLRKSIGYVSQDAFLVDGTIADNIAYGSLDVSMESIIEASKSAQAYDFINELPAGFNTVVGEQGQYLSGGQRQRISLARALLKNAPIYIFDEVTSALDNETEKHLQQSLKQLTKTKTVIIIAHKLHTIKEADIIYVLDKGQIIESGTHTDLISKRGVYFNLWKIQLTQEICNMCDL